MKQRDFEERSRARWETFEALLADLEAGGDGADPDRRAALDGLPRRYREICRDLAVARERRYGPRLVDRLNRLALDGHRVLYARDRSIAAAIARFFASGFPRAVRRDAPAIAVATALFVGPALVVAALIDARPELVYSVLDASDVRHFEAMYDPSAEHVGRERPASTDVGMFGFYVFNNIGIAFRAYAGGLLLGLGTAFVLLSNGLLLGAVAAHLGRLGFGQTFYSFVIGHGAFELTAIVLSGAAGLRLGWSVIAPGPRPRGASLRRAAAETVTLAWGVFAMLLVAAVVEAFWSSKGSFAPELKLVVGAFAWTGVIAYFAFVGRGGGRAQGAPGELAPASTSPPTRRVSQGRSRGD